MSIIYILTTSTKKTRRFTISDKNDNVHKKYFLMESPLKSSFQITATIGCGSLSFGLQLLQQHKLV
jgi:hypothetical protein